MKKLLAVIMTFSMLIAALSVSIFAQDDAGLGAEYADLEKDAWYYSAVESALRYGFMKGTHRANGEDWLFSPDAALTREQFVTILHRVASAMPNYGVTQLKNFKDIYEYRSAFSDVDNLAWYGSSLMWVESYGITNGVSDSEFGINRPITREEMATLIVRFTDMYSLISIPNSQKDPTPFKDISECSDWAKSSVEQMKNCNIIMGDENGNFNPKQTATRCEAAAVFVRLFEKAELDIGAVFDPANVKCIVFSNIDETTHEPKSFTVGDPNELKDTLAHFANGEILDSDIGSSLLGNCRSLTVYDSSDNVVCAFGITDSSIYINGFRLYDYTDGYFKTFCDRLG